MKIRCISRELTEQQRDLFKAPSRFRPNPRISVGKEYLVLGIVYIMESPQYGNTALFEILDDDDHLILYPAVLFEVTDGRCSRFWRAAIHKDGAVTLRPEEFYRQYFHDDLSEGDPDTRNVFRAVLGRLAGEFSAQR